jgi:hypothetical protein
MSQLSMANIKRMLVPQIVSVLMLLAVPSAARAESVRLTTLQADDTVVIKMRASGCFHYRAKYLFTFRRDSDLAGHVVVSVKDIKGLWHRRLGSRSLNGEEVTGLDAVLQAYHDARPGCISTTVERIELTLMRGGEVVGREMHFGGDCIASLIPGGVSLSQIVAGLQATGARQEVDAKVRPNNRLKPTARGRSEAESLRRTRAAA